MKILLITLLLSASHFALTCEKSVPPYTQNQCFASVQRLQPLTRYKQIMQNPLQNKDQIINSFNAIKAIVQKEKDTLLECWAHYKHLDLVNIINDIDTSLSGFNIIYVTPESLNQHDTMYKAYARQQLKLIQTIESYKQAKQH